MSLIPGPNNSKYKIFTLATFGPCGTEETPTLVDPLLSATNGAIAALSLLLPSKLFVNCCWPGQKSFT